MTIALRSHLNNNVDEAIVEQKLLKQFPKGNVFLTVKDVGIDIVLVKDIRKKSKAIRIQVKGTKYHYDERKGIEDNKARGWVAIKGEQLRNYCHITDYLIFLVHYINTDKKRKIKFDPYCLIIPSKRLYKLTKKYKKVNKNGVYNFYLHYDKKNHKVIEDRNKKYSLSKYYNAWKLLK